MNLSRRNAALLCVLIALLAFAESTVPYILAERNAPPGYHFSGQVMYGPDQNMYFSFISQARDGAFLLANKLTAIPNKPAFVNLEYWLVGFIQRITGMSANAVYQVWRLLGVLLLSLGFFKVAAHVLPDNKRRVAAFAGFMLAGGFGFLFGTLGQLGIIGFSAMQAGIIDARYGMVPLQQMIANPHFSLPHGLILLAYAFFIAGERNGQMKQYVFSGMLFMIIGLVRPYDLIPPFLIFPLYALLADGRMRIEREMLVKRAVPLLLILPVLAYNVWLFKCHGIFKYWSLQGHNVDSLPGAVWHFLAYGVVGLLAVARLAQARRYFPGRIGRFVMLWFAVTFVFIQLGKIIPAIGWSPQIGVYLLAPLALAAASLKVHLSKGITKLARAGVVAMLAASNLFLVMYYARKFTGQVKTDTFYTANSEMEAFRWMKEHLQGGVVLADNTSSQRIARYTKNAVVAAHYSVTPRFSEYDLFAGRVLTSTAMMSGSDPLPADVRVDYVYLKKGINNIPPLTGTYLIREFENEGVVLYRNAALHR